MKNNKEALKNATKAVAFILILFFIIRSLSYVLRTNGDSKDRFAGFYAEENNSIDVLMFGSSTIGASFCAPYIWKEYGFTAYPLSSNAQRTTAIKYLIEEGLKTQSPSLFVIEMRTFVGDFEEMATDEGHIREVTDSMRYSTQRIKTINAVADHYEDKWPFYIDIMKYHSNIGMLLSPSEWKKFRLVARDANKGFVLRNTVESYRTNKQPVVDKEKKVALQDKQEEVLRDLLGYLKNNNYEALFVVAPRDDEDDYQAYMNYAGDVVREYGFDYLDMNYHYADMDYDFSTDMNDGAHPNVWGALKCSDLLAQYIEENYALNKSYSEKVRKDWDRAYSDFIETYNNTEKEECNFE